MAETKEQNKGKKLGLSRPGKLELKKTVKTGQVRQSFSHGRSKMVTVEMRKKRTFAPDDGGHMTEVTGELEQQVKEQTLEVFKTPINLDTLQGAAPDGYDSVHGEAQRGGWRGQGKAAA